MPTAFRLSPADLAQMLGLPLGAGVMGWAVSDVISLLAAPGTLYATNIPVMPGKFVFGSLARWRWVTKTGGPAVGNAVLKIGNNGAHDNFVTTAAGTFSAANITSGAPDVLLQFTAGSFALDIGTTSPTVEIVTATTIVTAATGRLYFPLMYVDP